MLPQTNSFSRFLSSSAALACLIVLGGCASTSRTPTTGSSLTASAKTKDPIYFVIEDARADRSFNPFARETQAAGALAEALTKEVVSRGLIAGGSGGTVSTNRQVVQTKLLALTARSTSATQARAECKFKATLVTGGLPRNLGEFEGEARTATEVEAARAALAQAAAKCVSALEKALAERLASP